MRLKQTKLSGLLYTSIGISIIFGSFSVSCVPKAPIANRYTVAPEQTPNPPQKEAELPPKFEVTDRIEIKTSMGSMVVGLYGKSAPSTVANFLNYVDEGFYSGKIFHRVISGFMVQGGGYDETMKHAETHDPIRLELVPGLKHETGIIAMARQPNDLHSATSQFFLCVSSAPQLNGAYSAFGKLEKGEEVMYAISGVPTHSVETEYGKMDDVPITPVVIESIQRLLSTTNE
jgi:peptidyl-prolyl cis-trans isomerase A (cyclophilin A)